MSEHFSVFVCVYAFVGCDLLVWKGLATAMSTDLAKAMSTDLQVCDMLCNACHEVKTRQVCDMLCHACHEVKACMSVLYLGLNTAALAVNRHAWCSVSVPILKLRFKTASLAAENR